MTATSVLVHERRKAENPRPGRRAAVVLFASLTALYVAVILVCSSATFVGDESGYAGYASRILGHQPASATAPRLWWGPGYPLVLVPFAALGLPWTVAKLLNAVLLSGALMYFHALLKRHVPKKTAFGVTAVLGMYPPFMRNINILSAESLTLLLIGGAFYHYSVSQDPTRHRRLHLAAASLFLAYLAMTKVFFGYVLFALLLLSIALIALRRAPAIRRTAGILLLACAACVPYLAYTYSVTGRPFYWGSSGGMSLYWLSSPYPGEYGSWFSVEQVKQMPELAPHRLLFARLENQPEAVFDAELRSAALRNIAEHPLCFARNWVANLGRLLFSYPFSVGPQSLSTYFYLLPNMVLFVLLLFSIVPGALARRTVPFEMWAILVFTLAAFLGSSLVSAYERQFRPLVPGLCVWLSFVYFRVLRIGIQPEAKLHAISNPIH